MPKLDSFCGKCGDRMAAGWREEPFCPTCEFPRAVATAPPGDARQAAALGAIMTFTQAPHPAPCGTDACLLCLIESTAKDALRVGE